MKLSEMKNLDIAIEEAHAEGYDFALNIAEMSIHTRIFELEKQLLELNWERKYLTEALESAYFKSKEG